MVAIISIMLALGLLCLVVFGLHKYQAMEIEYSVDRSVPLPPLDRESRTAIEVSATNRGSSPAIPPGKENSGFNPLAATHAKSWQEELAELKKAGDMLSALAVCENEFPLWGAYNQACILLRAKLHSRKHTETELNHLLSQLYRTAAIAELLHDKSPQFRRLPLNQLKKLKLDQTEKLDMPYSALGYAHLRLIRKGDIKLMQTRWGRPLNHLTPRQLHAAWWQKFTAESG